LGVGYGRPTGTLGIIDILPIGSLRVINNFPEPAANN
jgi:hypothetical protein